MTTDNKIIPDKDTQQDPETLRLGNAFGEALGDLPTQAETNEAWKRFSGRINTHHHTARLWTSIAAAATIAVLVCVIPLRRIMDRQNETELFTAIQSPSELSTSVQGDKIIFSTPAATTVTLRLSDGTTVVLNANSRIEYPKVFPTSGPRSITFYGQARFKVAKDKNRPFIVTAGDMRTRVLGTVFDINAYSKKETSVTLFQGKVQVSDIKEKSPKNMVPGQKAILNETGLTVSRTNLTTAGNWISGAFEFDDMPLGDALRTIGTWYNADVVFHSKKLLSLRIHFMFPKSEQLQTVINALNDLGVARCTCRNNKIDVYPVD